MTEVIWALDDNFDFGIWLQKFLKSRCISNWVRESSLFRTKSHCPVAKRQKVSLSFFPCTVFLLSYLFALEKNTVQFSWNFWWTKKKNHCITFLLIMFSGNINLRVDLLTFQCFYHPPKISSKTHFCLRKKWLNLKLEISMD